MTGPGVVETGGLVADPGAVGPMVAEHAAGLYTPEQTVDCLLTRIEAVESTVQPWVSVHADQARADARALMAMPEERRRALPLFGVPVAVKDIIDVAGWPTRAGSGTRVDAPPAGADATVVSVLKAAGAIVLGKIQTTEFAYYSGPPPTRNPHDPTRTPGGSSSGSGAVVAAGMAPIAFGTQTAGSVNRPAAYCGVAAMKPSTGSISPVGVVPFAPRFDTPGLFGYRFKDAARAFKALAPAFLGRAPAPSREPLTLGRLVDPALEAMAPEMAAALDAAVSRLARVGQVVEPVSLEPGIAEITAWHTTISEHELSRIHRPLLDAPAGQVTDRFLDAIRSGLGIPEGDYHAALASLSAAIDTVWRSLKRFDALVVPAAPGPAPVGTATGDPRFITPMTALGGPMATIPLPSDPPLGLLVCGAPGTDHRLAAIAERIAEVVERPR